MSVNDYEHLTLNDNDIEWASESKHLRNNLNISRNDAFHAFHRLCQQTYCKLWSFTRKLLNKLFKLYCCSFYGSQMWRLGSVYFNKVCTAWNIAVRTMCNMPYTTHRWFLVHESTPYQLSIAETLYSLPT